jgi:hypothetical protein
MILTPLAAASPNAEKCMTATNAALSVDRLFFFHLCVTAASTGRERVWRCLASQQITDAAVVLTSDKTHPYSYSLLAHCRLEYLGDLGGGPIVAAAGPPQSRVERRHAAVVHDGDFRAVIDQVLDHAGPGPLHRAE